MRDGLKLNVERQRLRFLYWYLSSLHGYACVYKSSDQARAHERALDKVDGREQLAAECQLNHAAVCDIGASLNVELLELAT